MDRWNSRGGKSQRGEEQKREDQRRERVRRKKMQVRENQGKPRNTMFFQWFVAPEGRKVCSLKRRVQSHLARWEMKSCTPVWREAHLKVQKLRTSHVWSTFGSWAVEKMHAVVARSTSRSQKAQSHKADHSRRALLEVEMSKKCTPLWGEAHFEVKRVKNWRSRSAFGRSDVVSHGRRTRDCAPCAKWTKREGFVEVSTTTTATLHSTPLDYTTLHYITTTTTTALRYTTLHYATYITLHYATLHALRYATLNYTALRYTALHYNYDCNCTNYNYNYTNYNYNYNYTTLY